MQTIFPKSLKAPKLFRKTFFNQKLINQESVIISDLGESPEGIFWHPLMLRLDFHVIFILCLHRVFYKISTWKLFVYGKTFAREKIKSGRKSSVKKKRKNKVQRGKKEHDSVKKRKKLLCESDWYWRSSTLASRFPTKFARNDFKRDFLFFMQVTSLIQKRKQ